MDLVGEWLVLDGLVLGELEEEEEESFNATGGGGAREEEARMNEEVCGMLRAEVGSIVDLLLVNG